MSNINNNDDEEIGMIPSNDEGLFDNDQGNNSSNMQEDENGPFVTMDMNLDVNDDGGDASSIVEKPPRKMTSTSDATSVTAGLSVYDDNLGSSTDLYSLQQQQQQDGEDDTKKPQPPYRMDSVVETPGDDLHDDCEHAADNDDNNSNNSLTVESRCWIWFKRILLFFVMFGIIGFALVMIGARIERNKFEHAEGTTHLYQIPQVCAVDDPLTSINGTTYDSAEEAHNAIDVNVNANATTTAATKIAHCGECGSCSTAHDMAIMSRTAESLTRDSTRCAFKIFIGRRAVESCMEERVGFTPACEDCWLDNIICSFKACKFTCIKHKLFRKDNNKEDGSDELNDCLKCDERMCGPAFIECSGANRRRMGIVSDIGRNADTEQCKETDVDWNTLFLNDDEN